MIKKKYIILMLLCCITLMAGDKPASKNTTLTIGIMQDIKSLYPWSEESKQFESNLIMQNIYETLFRFKEGSSTIEPWLAKSYDVSADFKTWTIRLRENIKFHNGKPFDADDVKASLSVYPEFTDRITKKNEHEVVITLDEPKLALPATLARTSYCITSILTVSYYRFDSFKQEYYGTGPYTFQKRSAKKEIVLTANAKYWNKKPTYKKIIYKVFQNEKDLVAALKSQIVQSVPDISFTALKEIEKVPYLQSRTIPSLSIGYLAINTEKKPFDDLRVRMAIAHAINKEALVKKYFFNGQTGVAAKSFAPEQMLALNEPMLEVRYDVEKAKALLREAGYADGFEAVFIVTALKSNYLPDPLNIAEDIGTDLLEIGIRATTIQPDSREALLNLLGSDNYDMVLTGWTSETIDLNDFLTELYSAKAIGTSNVSRWVNKKFDDLIEQARNQKSPEERIKLYQQARQLFHQDMPLVPLFNPLTTMVWNTK